MQIHTHLLPICQEKLAFDYLILYRSGQIQTAVSLHGHRTIIVMDARQCKK